jgi:hypothetical protein
VILVPPTRIQDNAANLANSPVPLEHLGTGMPICFDAGLSCVPLTLGIYRARASPFQLLRRHAPNTFPDPLTLNPLRIVLSQIPGMVSNTLANAIGVLEVIGCVDPGISVLPSPTGGYKTIRMIRSPLTRIRFAFSRLVHVGPLSRVRPAPGRSLGAGAFLLSAAYDIPETVTEITPMLLPDVPGVRLSVAGC